MSAKLEQALANKQVLVQKLVTGEVIVHFNSQELKDIVISHSGVTDLLSKRGVTPDAIRNSNLKELLSRKYIQLV